MKNLSELVDEYSKKDGVFILNQNGDSVGEVLFEDEDGDWDCGVESCRGSHYVVEWNDETTYVCGKGLNWLKENVGQIL